MATWVFGYGSLVNRASLATTLGHMTTVGTDVFVATLHGYRRTWNATMGNLHDDLTDKYYVDAAGQRPDLGVTALGITATPDEAIGGVIFRVSGAQIARFDLRERRYDRIDVTSSVQSDALMESDDAIVTYAPSAAALRTHSQHLAKGTVVSARSYVQTIADGFGEMDTVELARFQAELTPPQHDLMVVYPN